MAQNSIGNELNDLLITHNFDVAALSTKTGKPAVNKRGIPDATEADMFSFDWVGPTGKNYGTMVILLDQNGGMTVYFGDNLGRTMDPEDKKAWYGDSETNSTGFLEQLKHFAIRTSKIRGGFNLDDLSKLKYAIAGQAALTESFYGTKKVSYSGKLTDARLMIKHSRPITEGDKRYRYVESLFIETAEGECFRLPFRKLAGGRAMLEHVRQGGNPYDMRGQHIVETVNQINVLSQFRRAHQGRVFEGAAGELVTETNQYYQQLNQNLKHMANGRGYNRYFESWKPGDISDSDMVVEDLRSMFIETRIDPRIEQALPMLAKIQQEAKAMKEADIFESWAARLVEGTWSLPDTPEKMTQLKTWLSEPKPLGPDAEDVTDLLYELLGDDALFDQLQGMAEEDPTADAVPIVQAWVTRNQDLSPTLAELATSFQTAAPTQPPAEPAPPAELAAPPAPAPAAPAPAAPAPTALPMEEGEDDLVDIGPALHGLESEFDKFLNHGDRMERDPAYGNKWRKHYAKIAAKERSRRGGNHPDHELYPDPEVDEGDNPSTFESLEGIKHLAGMPIKESVLTDDTKHTLHHIINTFKRDVKDFIDNGDMSDHLFQTLYDYYFDDMPYGTRKARDGDPYEWVSDRFHQDLGDHGMLDEDNVGQTDLGNGFVLTSIEAFGQTRPAVLDTKSNTYLILNQTKDGTAIARTPARYLTIKDGKTGGTMGGPMTDAAFAKAGLSQSATATLPPDQPVNECNYTMENEYCPVHGLAECYGTGVFESELARMKALLK